MVSYPIECRVRSSRVRDASQDAYALAHIGHQGPTLETSIVEILKRCDDLSARLWHLGEDCSFTCECSSPSLMEKSSPVYGIGSGEAERYRTR